MKLIHQLQQVSGLRIERAASLLPVTDHRGVELGHLIHVGDGRIDLLQGDPLLLGGRGDEILDAFGRFGRP